MAVEIATYLVYESGIFCSLLLKWLEYNHEPSSHILYPCTLDTPKSLWKPIHSLTRIEVRLTHGTCNVVFDVSFFRQPSPVDKLLFLPSRLTSKTSDAAMLISSEAGYLHWWALFGAKHEVGESLSHSCLSETWGIKWLQQLDSFMMIFSAYKKNPGYIKTHGTSEVLIHFKIVILK